MRKYILLTFFLAYMSSVFAQADGMSFTNGNWGEILAIAQKENKIIFLDAYTSWCGPCKLMAREVFPRKEVGDFYNANFINVQIDMEKGEGLELARKYNVAAYPTLLYIAASGTLLHRAVGFLQAEQLIEMGENALNPEKRFSAMDERFRNGDRDPRFLKDYLYASYQAMHGNHGEVADVYMETQDKWDTPENLEIIFLFADKAHGKLFDYLLENKALFEKTFNKEVMLRKIQGLILTDAFKDKTKTEDESIEEVARLYRKAFPDVAPKLTANFKMNYYQQLGNLKKFADTAVEFYDAYSSDDYLELNNVAWTFYEAIDDKEMLKKALGWARKSVKLKGQYFNMDTVAALYHKLGKKGKAKKAALRAIARGKEDQEDVSGTELLLKEIMR